MKRKGVDKSGTAMDLLERNRADAIARAEKKAGLTPVLNVDQSEVKDFRNKFGKTVAFLEVIGLRDELEDVRRELAAATDIGSMKKLSMRLELISKFVKVYRDASESVNRTNKEIIRMAEDNASEGLKSGSITVIDRIDYDNIAGETEQKAD